MRIDPPRDRYMNIDDDDAQRAVEGVARVSSAIEKAAVQEKGPGDSQHRSFAELYERTEPAGDSSVALDDPDRDEWTQEVIGARIHWQYGPDGRRKPFFRHQTRRLDEKDAPQEGGATDSDDQPR